VAFRESRWFRLVWIVPAILVGLFLLVLAARGIRDLPPVQSFMRDFPGESALPAGAPVGFPAWLGWQHFLNSFFLLFIIRTGWQVRTTKRPPAYWTRNNSGPVRTKNPPVRIGLHLWLHLSLDTLWVLNGIIFFVLIFATGQWVRIVPTSWDIFPNAVSVSIQYASFHWPTENGWVNYNALQTLSYFVITFIAAPLALITGIRMTPGLAEAARQGFSACAGARHPLPGDARLRGLHRGARDAGAGHGRPSKPQPHVRRPRRLHLVGRRHLRDLAHRHGGGLDRCAPLDSQLARRAHGVGSTLIRQFGRLDG